VGEKGGGPERAVYGAGCGSAAAGGGGGAAVGGGGGGGLGGGVCRGVCMSVQELSYCLCLPCCCTVLLQHGADPNIRNTDGKSALDLAEPSAKAVLTGQSMSVCLSSPSHTGQHMSVCLSVKSHTHTDQHVCLSLYGSCSVSDCVYLSPLPTFFSSKDAHFHSCFNVNIFAHRCQPEFISFCPRLQAISSFFLPVNLSPSYFTRLSCSLCV